MLRPIDTYFFGLPTPEKECMEFLRNYIINFNSNIKEEWKYGMPFYCYSGKMCCYLRVHKKYEQPYLGIVEGSKINDISLIQEKLARMKILLIDASKDIPVKKINKILQQVVNLYK